MFNAYISAISSIKSPAVLYHHVQFAGNRMGFTDAIATISCRRTGRASRSNKGRQSGLGVKKCNEMRDTCSVRSARHPCEISRNAIPSYVAHGHCRRPIAPSPPRPVFGAHWYIITILLLLLPLLRLSLPRSRSLFAAVRHIPAVEEEEWQVVSVTSGRI